MGSRFMTKGKVRLVPFPFDDLSATKVRPTGCLTDPLRPHRHVILAFIFAGEYLAAEREAANRLLHTWACNR
jgi:hypothetical protein